MNLRELLDFVVATPADGWHSVPDLRAEPHLLSWHLASVNHGDDGWQTELTFDSHAMLYVNVERPEVSIAWGLELHDELRFDWPMADPDVSACAADILLNGVLVHRESILMVDGARAYLPHPRPWMIKTGAKDQRLGYEHVGDTATEWEMRLARLLDDLARHGSEFDSYLERTGMVIVQGHPLDRRLAG